MNKNQAYIGIFTAIMFIISLASCTSHNSNRGVASPTPAATAYLGIEKMWKGHVVSINRNVLAVWVEPHLKAGPYDTASYVLGQLEPTLMKSDLQIVVIKVDEGKGIVNTFDSYVFVKDSEASWGRIEDKTMLDKIIQAGL